MSTSSFSRSAPIAIAPKPARFESFHQVSMTPSASIDFVHGNMSGVDSEGPTSPQNGVLGLPCETCRRRGVKCAVSDDDESTCGSCQASGLECSLVQPSGSSPTARKRKLNGDSQDENFRGGKRSSPGRADNRLRRPHQSSLSSTAGSVSLVEEMANFGGPTMLQRTLGLQDDRYSQYIGPTTDFEPSLINLSPFDPHDESLLARGTLRKVSENDTFLMLPDTSTPGHERVLRDVEEIQQIVHPHGRKLVDLYFEVVHPAFPIIQKSVFYEKYERSYREFSPPVLAAVYILAINWWSHSDELSKDPKPNVRRLEELIRSSLADAMFRPKLSTVQAGLLLSQRPEGDQWAPTAQLVAIAQELGLHLDCTHWKIPPWEKGLRRRLAWALYMQDKWGALVHGRPSHIFPSNWAVQPLAQNDFPDVEWNEQDEEEKASIERGRLVFVQMVQLSQILAEILDTFFSLQAMQNVANAREQGTHLILSLAKPIQIKLKEWYGSLPAAIKMDPSFSSAALKLSRLMPNGYLHLGYFATEITLHRRIIRSLEQTGDAVDSYVQYICRSAAKARLISAMDFVNRLTPGHLRGFWYFASKTNFALIGTFGSLLWATSPGREEADWYRRRLSEYRWTLSVSSKPGEGKGLTEFAMTMLDISTGLLKSLPEKPSLSRSGSTVDMSSSRRPSLFSMGMGNGGGNYIQNATILEGSSYASSSGGLTMSMGTRGMPRMSHDLGFNSMGSENVSGVVSPRSPASGGESSDEGMYDNFAPTAGMAGLGDDSS